MEIVFFILKLMGWLVLGILGLILGILLLVLFSAIVYRVDGKKEEKAEGRLCVTWFFHILSVVLGYQDEFFAQVKVFGKTVWKLKSEDGRKEDFENTEGTEGIKDSGEEFIMPEDAGEEIPETEKEESVQMAEDAQAVQNAEDAAIPEDNTLPLDDLFLDEEKKRKKQKKKQKIKNRMEKKKKKLQKLKFSFSEICGKLKQIEEKRQWLLEKWDQLKSMVQDPANQASVRLILRQIKKIFRHILPRKGSAEITFGREDPYLMGKILSYAGAAYPFVHKILVLHPVFGEDRLEGEVHVKGRIRLGVILGYVLRLLFNKNIRQKLKEVVKNGR